MLRTFSLSLILALAAAPAFAGHENIEIGGSATLDSCGGTVRATKSAQGGAGAEQLNLVFKNVRDCSQFDIVQDNGQGIAYDKNRLDGNPGNYFGSRTLPKGLIDFGRNSITIKLSSKSGEHADTVTVRFRAVPVGGGNPPVTQPPAPVNHGSVTVSIGSQRELPGCGGTLQVTKSPGQDGEQVNLVFRGVTNCSDFDILGDKVRIGNLDRQGNAFGGSRTIPMAAINEIGVNNVTIKLYSNSRKHSTTITLVFEKAPDGSVSPPSSW